jgi:hypothetical protein
MLQKKKFSFFPAIPGVLLLVHGLTNFRVRGLATNYYQPILHEGQKERNWFFGNPRSELRDTANPNEEGNQNTSVF